jgi:hypothetical protein
VTKQTLVGRDAGTVPFAAAVFGAFPTLAMLTCAAPHGNGWRWLGLQLDTVVITSLAALLCVRMKASLATAGAPALVLIWRLGREWWALSSLNALDHMGDSASVIFSNTLGALEPGLTAALFLWLAWLSRKRRVGLADANDRNFIRIAWWFVAVGLVGVWQSLANPDWYTLENLKGDGIYVSGVAWPDTKIIALTLSVATLINAAALRSSAVRRRAARRKFIDELDPQRGWKLAKHDAQVAPLFDPPTDRGLVLLEVEAPAGGYREGGLERPIARV